MLYIIKNIKKERLIIVDFGD